MASRAYISSFHGLIHWQTLTYYVSLVVLGPAIPDEFGNIDKEKQICGKYIWRAVISNQPANWKLEFYQSAAQDTNCMKIVRQVWFQKRLQKKKIGEFSRGGQHRLIFHTQKNKKTSSAGSSTLGHSIWARLCFTSWNLPDSQLCLESKTEPEWHRATFGGGGHCTERINTGRGHRTYFVDGGTYWGGDTAKHWKNEISMSQVRRLLGGWVLGFSA